jgi:hypothetical protein
MFSAVKAPVRVSGNVELHCTNAQELLEQAWEKTLQCIPAAREQTVSVPALWSTTTVLDHVFEAILLDKHYFAIVIRQDTGGSKTSHAATHNNGSISVFRSVCTGNRTHDL